MQAVKDLYWLLTYKPEPEDLRNKINMPIPKTVSRSLSPDDERTILFKPNKKPECINNDVQKKSYFDWIEQFYETEEILINGIKFPIIVRDVGSSIFLHSLPFPRVSLSNLLDTTNQIIDVYVKTDEYKRGLSILCEAIEKGEVIRDRKIEFTKKHIAPALSEFEDIIALGRGSVFYRDRRRPCVPHHWSDYQKENWNGKPDIDIMIIKKNHRNSRTFVKKLLESLSNIEDLSLIKIADITQMDYPLMFLNIIRGLRNLPQFDIGETYIKVKGELKKASFSQIKRGVEGQELRIHIMPYEWSVEKIKYGMEKQGFVNPIVDIAYNTLPIINEQMCLEFYRSCGFEPFI